MTARENGKNPRCQHVALRVPNVALAAGFYRDAFGAVALASGVIEREPANDRMFAGTDAERIKFAHLLLGGGTGIELFEFDPSRTVVAGDQTRDRFMHLCLEVDEVASGLDRAEQAGGRRCFPIGAWPSGPYVFLRDPDGHLIELLEGSFDRLMRRVVHGEAGATSAPIDRAALHHIGIRVPDVRRAVSAYQEAFGATVHGFYSVPSELAEVLSEGPAGTSTEVAFLGFDGGVGCELFEFAHPVRPFRPADQSNDAVMHIGFQAANLDRAGVEIVRSGGQPLDVSLTCGPPSIAQYLDAHGHPVELTTMEFSAYARWWPRATVSSSNVTTSCYEGALPSPPRAKAGDRAS